MCRYHIAQLTYGNRVTHRVEVRKAEWWTTSREQTCFQVTLGFATYSIWYGKVTEDKSLFPLLSCLLLSLSLPLPQ